MSPYILVIIAHVGSSGGIAIHDVPFNDKDSCEAAATAIYNLRSDDGSKRLTYCFPRFARGNVQ